MSPSWQATPYTEQRRNIRSRDRTQQERIQTLFAFFLFDNTPLFTGDYSGFRGESTVQQTGSSHRKITVFHWEHCFPSAGVIYCANEGKSPRYEVTAEPPVVLGPSFELISRSDSCYTRITWVPPANKAGNVWRSGGRQELHQRTRKNWSPDAEPMWRVSGKQKNPWTERNVTHDRAER